MTFCSGEKILIYGLTTRKYLGDYVLSKDPNLSFTIICFGDLLLQESEINFYESPRQRLSTLLESALLENHTVIIFENFNEFIEEPGLWFYLKDFWFKRLEKNCTIIASVPSKTEFGFKVDLVKDHFLTVIHLSDRGNLIDLMEAEREAEILKMDVNIIIDKMIKEGRTCAQLINPNALIKSQSVQNIVNPNDLTLDKIYGIDQEIKKALLNGSMFVKGIQGPRGILLHGPPGTGKTRLVLALSRTIQDTTRFISVASSDLLRAEVGVSEEKLKEIFNLARSSQPSVIFFDEIDAIFPENPPLNLLSLQHQLIAELDTLERDQIITRNHCKVFLIAATNYFQKVSKRILGINRFHLKFEIGIPNDEERWEILTHELEKENLDKAFIHKLHKATKGKSPAEITKIIQDAYKNYLSRVSHSAAIHDDNLKEIDFSIK